MLTSRLKKKTTCNRSVARLAKLPSVSARVAHDKSRHRFISGSGLELVVCAVLLLAFAALQQVCFGSLNRGLNTEED